VQIDVRGAPGPSKGVPGSISRAKTPENRPKKSKIFEKIPFLRAPFTDAAIYPPETGGAMHLPSCETAGLPAAPQWGPHPAHEGGACARGGDGRDAGVVGIV